MASINQNPHQKGLDQYRCIRKPHSARHIASGRNFRKKNIGVPNGSNKIWGKRQIYRRPHSVVVESGTNSLLGLLSCGKNGSFLPFG